MILMNANRLMLWGLYIGFILSAISLIFSGQKIKT